MTGASVQVASEMLPNSTERAVTISGNSEAVIQCIYHICVIMSEVRGVLQHCGSFYAKYLQIVCLSRPCGWRLESWSLLRSTLATIPNSPGWPGPPFYRH